MAMVECHECGEQISERAKSCPKCGYRKQKTKWWLWVPLAVVAAFLTFGAIVGQGKGGSYDAERAVKILLKDPDGARFTGPYPGKVESGSWCGSVNAKNSFGAYVGERPFYIRFDGEKIADIWLQEKPDDLPPHGWYLNCRS